MTRHDGGLLLGARERISEDQNDGVASKEHFGDVTILVHWLGLLFPFSYENPCDIVTISLTFVLF